MVEKAKVQFKVPKKKEREGAIGKLDPKLKIEQATFSDLEKFYSPIPEPGPADWLSCHPSKGQTFNAYTKEANTKIGGKKKIYILALDLGMSEDFLLSLKEVCKAFYHPLEVKLQEGVDIKELDVANRINEGTRQYNAGQILEKIKKYKAKDAYCMISITNEDLYPRPSWNFVFGFASKATKTGVFSFARYNPCFFGAEEPPNLYQMLLYRASRVMVHELGHMFGLPHCVFFSCCMNGSNHDEESQIRPFDLCPVCLRKLQFNIGFDYLKRFIAFQGVFHKLKEIFTKELGWVQQRIDNIQNILEKK